MADALDDGEEKEAFAKGFSWLVERPAYGDCQLRLGPRMAIRLMQEAWRLPTRRWTTSPTIPEP